MNYGNEKTIIMYYFWLHCQGALMSVQIGTVVSHVHVATSALFIKKFRQHEHAAALECAFLSVLHTPIKLKITSTGEEPTNC